MATQQLFEVLYVEKNASYNTKHIDVGIKYNDGEEKEIQINLAEYETWLEDSDSLEWCQDYSQAGEHVQHTGRYTLYDYWELATRYHEIDMYDYLVKHKVKFEDLMRGIYDGIQAICKEYKEQQ